MKFHHRLFLSLFLITIALSVATYVEWTKFQNNPPPEDDDTTSMQTWEYLKWATIGVGILLLLSAINWGFKIKKGKNPTRLTKQYFENVWPDEPKKWHYE